MAEPSKAGGRRLLLAGFGGLLLLMLVAGVDAIMVLREVRSSDAQERNLYLRRAAALDRVRTGIYQSAIVMRAYLLADEPETAARELEEWRAVRRGAEQALAECAAVLDPAEAPQLPSLRIEVQVYWRLLDFLTTVPEKDRRAVGGDYLNREVVQRRGETLDLVDRIDQIERDGDVRGRRETEPELQPIASAADRHAGADAWRGSAAGGVHHPAHAGIWKLELEKRYQEGVGRGRS